LADDDPDTLFLLHLKLSEAFPDSTFTTFPTAEEALDHILNQGTDILITDHGIGRMNGCELIRRLRRMGSDLPIIMISGNPYAENEAREAGATEFVLKEVNTSTLENQIRKLTGVSARSDKRPRVQPAANSPPGRSIGSVPDQKRAGAMIT
jgi:DNA-binding response OmpR family regulator